MKMDIDFVIDILVAFRDGVSVERRSVTMVGNESNDVIYGFWYDVDSLSDFVFDGSVEYRVKLLN